MFEHILSGCRPEPLASYLKAVGVLRLLHAGDLTARGWWSGDVFRLRTALSLSDVTAYLAESYSPTPILAAWNAAGGLYMRATKDSKTKQVLAYDKPTTNTQATDALATATAPRLAATKAFIEVCRGVVSDMGLESSPDAKTEKPAFLARLRDEAADEALPWIDAAFVLSEDSASFPPLLGTGGNDGNLDFANNFQQQLPVVMSLVDGSPTVGSLPWLRAALFGHAMAGMASGAPGQFDPGRGGGPNSGEGFSGSAAVNPWDYILFIEGALAFAGAATKRLESEGPGTLSYPFTVRTSSAGSGGLSLADEGSSRNEIWLPMWDRSCSWPELSRLFGEGRATVGRRVARDAVDFARAVGTLGVDRGISSFVRYGFLKRNGLAYVASPLGRWKAERSPGLDLIDERLDGWLTRLRRVGQDKHTPSSIQAGYRRVSDAVMALAQAGGATSPSAVQRLMVELAAVERATARSPSSQEKLSPVPPLDARWAGDHGASDGTVEFRLALSLASAGLRRRMVPLGERGDWGHAHDPGVVWGGAHLVDDLLAVLHRDEVEWSAQTLDPRRESSRLHAELQDVLSFVRAEVDDERLATLTRALCLLAAFPPRRGQREIVRVLPVDPLWALGALAWDQRRPSADSDILPARRTVGLLAAGSRGDSVMMSTWAARRLRPGALRHRTLPQSSVRALRGLAVDTVSATSDHTRRCAAALAFPLSHDTLERLTYTVFRLDPKE